MLLTAILLSAYSWVLFRFPPFVERQHKRSELKTFTAATSPRRIERVEWFQRFWLTLGPDFIWVFDLVRREESHTTFCFTLSLSLSFFVEHPTSRRLTLNRVALVIYGIRCDRTHFRSARADIGACPSVCMGRFLGVIWWWQGGLGWLEVQKREEIRLVLLPVLFLCRSPTFCTLIPPFYSTMPTFSFSNPHRCFFFSQFLF